LAAFLKEQQYAALLQAADRGTVMVVKAPRRDIRSLRAPVPIELRHELYRHPTLPVVRLVTRIYDQPDHPLALETFVNVDDESQRQDYGELARQNELDMLFYDERLEHLLTKRVDNGGRRDVLEVLITALRLRARVPDDRFDFDRAKADVMARTEL
jgi:hypothetical protein